MPVYPGLSDVESCSDWDVGMPMDEDLLNDKANEAYWEQYRSTPKAFVTLAAGRQMWANRFGDLTAVRFAGEANTVPELRAALKKELDPALTGLTFQPVREQALAAVSQAMGFGGLFLGMSGFLIAAALLLTGLLFAFGIEQRAPQMGTLLALGFRAAAVQRLLILEGLFVATAGAGAGAIAGMGYTRALIFGLTQFWGGAVAHATIGYHARTSTIVLGITVTLVCAVGTMWFIARRVARRAPCELLAGIAVRFEDAGARGSAGRRALQISIAAATGSAALVLFALIAGVQNVAPVFFGSGALLLVAGLAFFRRRIAVLNAGHVETGLSAARLAFLNLCRRPGRAIVVTGLVACGVFLVLGVSSMQEDLEAHAAARYSGTGGFALVAESTIPLPESPAAMFENPGVAFVSIKVRDGDDASCLNLNRAQTPEILGVNVEELASRRAFAGEALWRLLHQELPGGAIPALVGDTNTALWTLRRKTGTRDGDVLVYPAEDGGEVDVKLVGQLPMRLSVFQGTILISQEHFTRLFPSEDGFRMFLIDSPESGMPEVAGTLVRGFDRYGMEVVSSVQRLYEYYSVEASYLAMFLVLGGLGVAVGTLGLTVVILRNLHERRGELAMLIAFGFAKRRLSRMALMEYGILVASGLAIGGISAAVSMLPAYLSALPTIAAGNQALVAALVVAASTVSMWAAVAVGVSRLDLSALRDE
jgi:hypothetical protein